MKFEWYYFKNFYTQDQCHAISNLLKTCPASMVDSPASGVTKTAKVSIAMWRDVRSLLGGLEDAVHHINKEYFSFNIYRMTDYDSINHNVYLDSEQGQYEWHKDFSLDRMYDLKLTVIANISTTPYEGGKFELFVNEPLHIKEIDEPGSVLIFPSFLNHRVNPVTQGTRETMSFWVPGPHFK